MKAKFFKILAIILPLFTSCGKPSVSPVPFSWPFDPDASYRAITDEMAKIENFIKEAEKEESKLYVKYIHDEYHTEYIDNENLFVTELKDIEFQPLDPEYVHEWATDKTSFTVSFIDKEYFFKLKEDLTDVIVSASIDNPDSPYDVRSRQAYRISKESGSHLLRIVNSIIDGYTAQE